MAEAVLIYTTWPDAEAAERCAAEAVAERLAACANIGAPIRSVYRWQGAVETAQETPMLLKTSSACAEALSALIRRLHPYEVPAILALEARRAGSNPAFLAWIEAEADGSGSQGPDSHGA